MITWVIFYPVAPMAVPKQKQSHARTNKRRSQHKAARPTINECPTCHSPRRPHRVCPVCGSYAGREVVAPGVGHDHDHDHDH
jgi:large subunit ribosomal protein L32